MTKKRSDLWFLRTGEVVTIVGLKSTDHIVVNRKVFGMYETFVTQKVSKIGAVHGAKRSK